MNKQDILLNSINDFYKEKINRDILLKILNKSGGISLRNLEWFITTYSKKYHTRYKTRDGKIFTVHCNYKSSLDGYSKKLFDPFCRTERIEYKLPCDDNVISTTVAQLNFIKWCIKNDVIKYMNENKNYLFNKKPS